MTGPGVQIIVTGQETVVRSFSAIPAVIRGRVGRAVRSLGVELSNRVKSTKLSGQVLRVRTGRLRSSITARFTEEGDVFSSTVGTNVVYGRFWELGFHGIENVRGHSRHVRGRDVRGARPDLKSGRGKIGEGVAFVRPFARHVDQAARPFLRPALEEMREIARERLTRALFAR